MKLTQSLPLCLLATLASFEVLAKKEVYNIDAAHSSVQFSVGHLGLSKTAGRFDDFKGSFTIDTKKPTENSAEFTIQATSINTNHEKRDKHLRSPDFFNVKVHPTITFKSTRYVGSADTGKLYGDITLNGVTKPATLDINKVGENQDPWGGYRSGYIATTEIKRGDFGVSYFIPGVSNEVDLTILIEGIKK